MIRTYHFDSDYMAEKLGWTECPRCEVDAQVSISFEEEVSYLVLAVRIEDRDVDMDKIDPQFLDEVKYQVDQSLKYDDDVFGDWCEFIKDKVTDLSHLEDRDD